MANTCPVAYVFGIRTKNSAGTVVSACKPYGLYSSTSVFSGITTLGPPYYEPIILDRETLAFGLRDVVIGYRAKVPVEFAVVNYTSVTCIGGACSWDAGVPANFSGLSTILSDLGTAGYYCEICLNGDSATPNWYRAVIEEFSQETLDPERFVGLRMRFLFAKADIQTSNMNSLSITTW